MPQKSVQDIIQDPNFQGLPTPERIKVMNQVDPNFNRLPDPEKLRVVTSARFRLNSARQEPEKGLLQSVGEFAKSMVPTPREATGMVGAAIGSSASVPAYVTGPGGVAATALGGGLGYTGGTHLYDIMTGTHPEKDTTTQDVLSGALQEGIGPKMTEKIGSRVERGIPKAVERAIEPGTPKEKFALKGISSELSKDFPIAATHQGLYEKAQTTLNGFTKKLEAEWTKLPANTQIPTSQAKFALQQERRKLVNQQTGQLIPGMQSRFSKLSELIDYFNQHPTLTPSDIRNHRQLWDEMINWWRMPAEGKSAEPEAEFALKTAGNGLRDTINRTYPKIRQLNSKVSPWINAVKMLERGEASKVGKFGSQQFYRLIPEAGGAAGGALLGKYLGLSPEEGAVLGAGIVGLRQIMRTPAWQTTSIPVRRQVARLMSAGMTQRAVGIMLGQVPQEKRGEFLNSIGRSE